jgi:hypothetical protein
MGVLGSFVVRLTRLIGVWPQFSNRSDNQTGTPR